MAKSETLVSSATPTIEIPPNKAIAAAGSAPIGSVIVALALHYFAPDTSVEIVALWTALANTVIAPLAVYLTPHGAIVKES